jgi:glycosyltransferase involved in cell wall biosynthesis
VTDRHAAMPVSRPLRICMITTFYPPYSFGGDAVYVQQLSRALASRGHRVDVIHCGDAYRALTSRDPHPEDPEPAGVTVHRLQSPFGILSPLLTHQTGLPLLKQAPLRRILATGFDVIHYHNVSLIGGAGVLDEGVAPVKLFTLHEYWLVCPTHMLFKYGRDVCRRPWCVACTIVHRRPPQLWRYSGLLQRATRGIGTFIAPSRFVRDKHRQLGFEHPIAVLPYFTAHSAAPARSPGWPPASEPYFLFVGRLERLKGLQTLIPIFRRYTKACLLVAGRGSYEKTLREMAAGTPSIVFLGHQSGERLRQLYANAIALIVPSVWYEVFGIVILEAFAQRTPALVRNIGAMPEIVTDTGGGVVYDSDAELVTAMDRLLAEPAVRTTLGHRGHEAVRTRWSAAAHVDGYLDLVQGGARGGAPHDAGAR